MMSRDTERWQRARTVYLTRRGAWWVLVLVCLAGCGAALIGLGIDNRPSPGDWNPPNAESLRADAFLESHFAAGESQLVLLAATSGSVDDARAAQAGQDIVEGLAADPRTAWVRGYWPHRPPALRTSDRHYAVVLVRLRGSGQEVRSSGDALAAAYTGPAGPLRVSAAGETAFLSESERLSERGLHLAEFTAAPLVLLILLWVFGSAVAALIPVLVGVFSVVTTTAFLRLLAGVTPVSALALDITTVLAFGLAVDYSLLLISRYREAVVAGSASGPAVASTLRTAGHTVAVSAAIVAAALCTLLLVPLPLLRSIAWGGAAVVFTSAAGALVVVPALLVLLGDRINRSDVFAQLRRGPVVVHRGAWFRLAGWVTTRPVVVTAVALGLLVVLAAPSALVRFGMYGDATLPQSSPVAAASRTLREGFDTGVSGSPVVVLPDFHAERSERTLDGYARALSLIPGVRRVETATGAYRAGRSSPLPAGQAGSFSGKAGTWLSVTPHAHDPLTPEGSRLVERIRRVRAPVPPLVGGPAARLADIQRVLADRLPLVALIVAVSTFLILLGYTRSLLVPLKALLMNVLSLAATFGILVAVFQEGWFPGGPSAGITDVLVPLMAALAFGLSMDYEVFLLSRILEEHRSGTSTPLAVATGLQQTGRLFTSAAVVFAVTMASLALSGLLHLRVVGVGLAVAVLLDCTIVRALLVPAVMRLAGGANWWLPCSGTTGGGRGAQRGAVPKTWSQ